MATIPYQPPIANVPGLAEIPVYSGLAGSGGFADAAFVVLSSGVLADAGADPAAVAGIAQHDSYAVIQQIDTDLQGVFGTTQFSSTAGLMPTQPGECLIVTLQSPIIVAINLDQNTGWGTGGTYQATIGTSVGLGKDSTTGFYFADTQATNKIATIVGKLAGPGQGIAGDVGARVFVQFTAADLQVAGR